MPNTSSIHVYKSWEGCEFDSHLSPETLGAVEYKFKIWQWDDVSHVGSWVHSIFDYYIYQFIETFHTHSSSTRRCEWLNSSFTTETSTKAFDTNYITSETHASSPFCHLTNVGTLSWHKQTLPRVELSNHELAELITQLWLQWIDSQGHSHHVGDNNILEKFVFRQNLHNGGSIFCSSESATGLSSIHLKWFTGCSYYGWIFQHHL